MQRKDAETQDANRGHLPARNNRSDIHAAYVARNLALATILRMSCARGTASHFASPRSVSLRRLATRHVMILHENDIYDILSQYTFLYVANIMPFNQNIVRYDVSFSENKRWKKEILNNIMRANFV